METIRENPSVITITEITKKMGYSKNTVSKVNLDRDNRLIPYFCAKPAGFYFLGPSHPPYVGGGDHKRFSEWSQIGRL